MARKVRAGADHRVIASSIAELFITQGPAALRTLTLNGERFKPSPEAMEAWTSVAQVPTKGVLHVEV